jgi:hypothetical protein
VQVPIFTGIVYALRYSLRRVTNLYVRDCMSQFLKHLTDCYKMSLDLWNWRPPQH